MKHFNTSLAFAFFLLCAANLATAQIPFLQLAQHAGGTEWDYYMGICPYEEDGGWLAAGSTRSAATPPLIPTDSDESDCILTRYSSSGSIEWSRVYNHPENQYSRSIFKTSDGGYLVGGSYTIQEPYNFDMFLMKLDAQGNEQWSQHYGGSGYDGYNFLEYFEVAGGFAFATITNSNDGDVVGNNTSYALWYVTVNNVGDIVSQFTFELGIDDLGYGGSFLHLSDGGFAYLAGHSIYRFDSTLQLQWQSALIEEEAYELVELPSGDFMMLSANGYAYGGPGITWFANKYSAQGQFVWQKQLPVDTYTYIMELYLTTDGLYGTSVASSAGDIENSFLLELSLNGDLLWIVGEPWQATDNYYWNLSQLSNGDFIAVGSNYSVDADGNAISDFKLAKYGTAYVDELGLDDAIDENNICGGDTYTVDFHASTLNGQQPLVQIQMSDIEGSFDNPYILGQGSISPITMQVPPALAPGYYLIRSYIPATGSASQDPSLPGITIEPSQAFLFAESMGTVASTTAIATHEAANEFDNDPQTMTGTADVASGNSSSGQYTGSSGGANINFVSTNEFFEIAGINTTGITDPDLSFGAYRSNSLSSSAAMTVAYSTDGVSYTSLNYSLSLFSSGWTLVNIGTLLPQVPNLRIKFTRTSIAISTIRVDDIKITGMMGLSPILASGPVNWCGAGSVVLTAPTANDYVWNTGATTMAITVTTAGSYHCTVTTTNGCSVTLDPITITTAAQLWYSDLDADGYGGASAMLCAPNATYHLSSGSDCNDSNPGIYPGATEICNDLDDNCNGQIDEDADSDGDGYFACDGDCNDYDPYIHPGATELLNGVDDNCDGIIDVTPAYTWYLDADSDGYGTPFHVSNLINMPSGYVTNAIDCDDDDSSRYPTADDTCGDNIDNNCDGIVDNCVCVGDMDGNGAVNVGDLLIFTSVFGNMCE